MCDCAEELERKRNEARRGGGLDDGGKYQEVEGGRAGVGRNVGGRNVGGRNVGGRDVGGRDAGGRDVGGRGVGGRGGSDKSDYWTNLIGGAALFMGLFTLLYKTFDLGTLWREKVSAMLGGVLDSMCHNYVKDPCGGLKINDCKRKWPYDDQPKISTGKTQGESCQATIVIELDDDDLL